MRLKRKLSYEVREPGPVNALVKKFRTKARARRFARANGYKWFTIIRHTKRRQGDWKWRLEMPLAKDIQDMVEKTIELHAKGLGDQYIKARNELVLATLLHLDKASLKLLFDKKDGE